MNRLFLPVVFVVFLWGCHCKQSGTAGLSETVSPSLESGVKTMEECGTDEMMLMKVDGIKLGENGVLNKNDSSFVQALVVRATQKNDIRMLRKVLENYPPDSISSTPLEKYLAGERLGYFQCLFDSYRDAKTEYAKRTIYICLRRAFPVKGFIDNQDCISKAENWFKKNRRELMVYGDYYVDNLEYSTEHIGLFLLIPKLESIMGE